MHGRLPNLFIMGHSEMPSSPTEHVNHFNPEADSYASEVLDQHFHGLLAAFLGATEFSFAPFNEVANRFKLQQDWIVTSCGEETIIETEIKADRYWVDGKVEWPTIHYLARKKHNDADYWMLIATGGHSAFIAEIAKIKDFIKDKQPTSEETTRGCLTDFYNLPHNIGRYWKKTEAGWTEQPVYNYSRFQSLDELSMMLAK